MASNSLENINHIHRRSSCLKTDVESKAFKTVVFLVFLQVSYVVFDLVEAKTHNNAYGITAGFFMVFFGLSIILVSVFSYWKFRKMNRDLLFEFLEGFVYTSLGAAITGVRWTNGENGSKFQEFISEEQDNNKEEFIIP